MSDDEFKKGTSPFASLMEDLRSAASKGQEILSQQAKQGKKQLELLQLKRDRRTLFERLGQETYLLLQEKRIPLEVELGRPYQVIQEIDVKIQALEEEIGGF